MNDVEEVDVCKGKGMVLGLHPFGEVVATLFAVGQIVSELKEMTDYLKSLNGKGRVVMERTGRDYEPVSCFPHFVSKVKPERIKHDENNALRKVKIEKADVCKMAFYGHESWAELHQHISVEFGRLVYPTRSAPDAQY